MSPLKYSFVAVAVVALLGCRVELGNKHIVTEPRTVGAFTKLSVQSGIHVQHDRGDRALSLTTDENLLPFIETFVEGDTLILRAKPTFELAATQGPTVALTNDTLLGLDVSGGSVVTARASAADTWSVNASGGSTVTLTDVQSPTFHLDASGGSGVDVQGLATDATVNASGGSHLDTDGLAAENVTLNASGGSALKVRATKTVKGDASGGSTVTVTGNPASRQVSTSGGSTVAFE